MANSRFLYVTYIRTTPQKLWEALTKPELTRLYWHGVQHITDWRRGSDWRLTLADGVVADSGKVLEANPPRRLVLEWRNEFRPELRAEGYSRCTFEIEGGEGVVRLAVTHEMGVARSKLIKAVSDGWPQILSSLKRLLETGAPLDEVRPESG